MLEIDKQDYLIDLQLFSAEDEGRTEEPSERRLREEKDKGNVPKTHELPGAIVLLGSLIVLYFFGNSFFIRSMVLFKKYLALSVQQVDFRSEGFGVLMKAMAEDMLVLMFPILGVAFIGAVIGSLVQVGFIFTPAVLNLNFQRITPNFRKVLPTRQTLVNLAKSIAKVVLIGWVSYIVISKEFLDILLMGNMGIKAALTLLVYAAFKIFFVVGIILLVLGIADFYYQKFEHEESLKMTPSEAKQELKESEGDKAIIHRRRNMMRDFLRRGMLQKVPKADVVIVNPTHYAVALAYDPELHYAPIVVAKGADEFALLIRRVAKKYNVPMIEDRVQARMLYDESELDQPIPVQFFRAVSIIISKLDKYKKRKVA